MMPRFRLSFFPPSRLAAVVFLSASLLAPGAGVGQEDEPPAAREPASPPATEGHSGAVASEDAELKLLEDNYLAAVVKARQELADKYLAALQQLQDSLTQSGELEGALLVKQERERTMELLERRPEVGAVADARATIEPVFLRGADATVQGKVKVSPANGALFAWEKKGSYAEWTLPDAMVPGLYEVVLHCSAAEGEGGSFDVTLGDDQVISATVAGKGAWSDWRDLHAGNLNVTAKGGILRVTATAFTNARLMNLRYLVLGPKGTAARILKGEKFAPGATDGSGLEKPAKPAADFSKFENARLVPDPANDADSFLVTDGERQYALRLYFVDAPHANAADYRPEDQQSVRNIETEAAYFGIAAEASLEIGREAADFVSRLLAGQPLTVYTRLEKDGRRSGRYYAIVIVNGKPLSTLLVENGYARIEGQTTDLPNGVEAASHVEALRKAEAAAKAQRRGAWGKR